MHNPNPSILINSDAESVLFQKIFGRREVYDIDNAGSAIVADDASLLIASRTFAQPAAGAFLADVTTDGSLTGNGQTTNPLSTASGATTATAVGNTALLVSSNRVQEFTGTTTQTVTLPAVSTLRLGQQYEIINNSTGTVTINSSGGNLVQALLGGQRAVVTCVVITGTTAASWSVTQIMSVVDTTETAAWANGGTGTHTATDTHIAAVVGANAHNMREVLTAARTYYVRADGNDANTGLANTSGGAFLTWQKAIDVVAALDLSIYDVTIQVADGTYTGTVRVTAPFVGKGSVTIQGNSGTPANVIISVTSNDAIKVSNAAVLTVKDFELRTTASGSLGYGIYSENGSFVAYGNIRFGAIGIDDVTCVNGNTKMISSCEITGNASGHVSVYGGVARIQTGTLTLTGTPAFAADFYMAFGAGTLYANGVTYSGSGTGRQYTAQYGGVIYANTTIPGNVAGRRLFGGIFYNTAESLIARNSAQFDKTSSTVLADVTGLSLSLLAGTTYGFEATLFTASNVAGGVKAAIAGTATATSIIYEGQTFQTTTLSAAARTTTLGNAVGAVTAVTTAMIIIRGTITVNAAGTLTVQFAQNASNGTASSVLANSTFKAWLIQ